jgi:hypothetical protein
MDLRSLRHVFAMSVTAAAMFFLFAPRGRAEGACADEVEYEVSADLKIEGTPLGEGNGTFKVGPGRIVLRFEGDDVKMTKYAMREHVVVTAKNVGFKTTVTSDTSTTATPNACGSLAEGTIEGGAVRWRTPVRGMVTQGTIACAGSFCGKFGAPPRGQSTFHDGPLDIRFSPFVLSPDHKTFSMPMTFMSKTSAPKQSASMSFAARESKRACVPVTCR